MLRKYFTIFRISLIERLTYRSDFLIASALRLLPMLTTILLWSAVFEGSKSGKGSSIGGFNLNEMIAYLLLVHISRMFSSMPGLAGGIALDIREGTLKKYLLQPLDMLGYLIVYRVSHKIAYIVTSFIPYAIMFLLCADYFKRPPDNPLYASTIAAYILSLLLAFAVGFYFEACIGMVGFWLLEVTSLLYIVNTLNYFISGHMFPLDLLPSPVAAVLKLLPFQYMAYFPAAVFLGKVEGAALWQGLLTEAAWAVGLLVLSKTLFRVGLKRYSAYGG